MEPIADTEGGKVAGREKAGVLLFAGIPYAAPPTGDRRWRAPERHAGWSGTRAAKRFGQVAPQGGGVLGGMLSGGKPDWSEDCLFLNVQTPALDDAGRPVMVWIHGGAFVGGTGAVPWYDGSNLIRRGDVVVVSLNYRLGAFGWLELGHLDPAYRGSGNCGLLDQVAAIEWVRRNIAGFGGDPDNITIFGESAGAMSIATLLGTPAAAGTFRRAIAQSGAAQNVSTPDEAAEVTDAVLAAMAVADVDGLFGAPAEQVLAAQNEVSGTRALRIGKGSGLPFGPVVDGVVLPRPPLDAVRDGSAAGVPLLLGTNRDEWNLFSLMDARDVDEATILRRLARVVGDPTVVAQAYADDTRTHDERWNAIMTDVVFRIPAIRLAEAQAVHQPDHTFLYQFEWASTALDGRLGSAHAIEIPFVFDTLDKAGVSLMLGEGAPAELAEAMQRSWLAFVHHDDPSHDGLPPWPAYDEQGRATMHFGTPCHLEHDPAPAQREVWAGWR